MGEVERLAEVVVIYAVGIISVGAAFTRFGHPMLRRPYEQWEVAVLGFMWPVWVLTAVVWWAVGAVTRAIETVAGIRRG